MLGTGTTFLVGLLEIPIQSPGMLLASSGKTGKQLEAPEPRRTQVFWAEWPPHSAPLLKPNFRMAPPRRMGLDGGNHS